MEDLDIHQILNTAPALLATEAMKVVEAQTALDLAEHNLAVARAHATLRYAGGKNSKIIEANVEIDPDVQSLAGNAIRLDGALKLAKMRHDKVEHEWVSVRKLAGLSEAELRAQKGNTYRPSNHNHPD